MYFTFPVKSHVYHDVSNIRRQNVIIILSQTINMPTFLCFANIRDIWVILETQVRLSKSFFA